MLNLPKNSIKKSFLILPFLAIGLAFYLGTLVSTLNAQTPTSQDVPCDEVRPSILHPFQQEFHSLRPYQTSPCNPEVEDVALFCGNDLIIEDAITGTPGEPGSSCRVVGGKTVCTFVKNITREIKIDLSKASLPIAGNTELVVNSLTQEDQLDSAEKANEYLSWYLNGVINRAEYKLANPEDEGDIAKIVNFSGPLKKLLPWSTQAILRKNTIEKARDTRHDQIVGCTYDLPVRVFGIFEVARIGGIPGPCYESGLIGNFVNFFSISGRRKLTDWEKRLPPIEDEKLADGTPKYKSFQEYWVAYKEWRGERCEIFEAPNIVPVIGGEKFIMCFDDPTIPNFWAKLYANIPFSSTEDRKGEVEVSDFGVKSSSEDLTISNIAFSNQEPAELFFAHMEETSKLAKELQNTYAPEGYTDDLKTTGIARTESCDLVNIRTNPGDDLFAGEIRGDLSYQAEFTCEFERAATNACERAGGECVNAPSCARSGRSSVNAGAGCENVSQVCCSKEKSEEELEPCTKTALVSLSVVSKTPEADDVWKRTVAGNSAAFKRIAPKIGPDGPIGCLLDIPTATKVSYEGEGLIYAGNPGGKRAGESAELYFPHLGGVKEYFLTGIQTILRPKGYGEPIIYGAPGDPLCTRDITSTDICSDNCNSDPTNVNMAGVKEKFIDLANRWVGTGNPRIDKYEQVVSSSLAKGVDPIFTLAIWLHESGGSNYRGICEKFGRGDPSSLYCQRVQDFGINREELETIIDANGNIVRDNFSAQLSAFLDFPNFALYACNIDEVNCAWEVFGARYTKVGSCTPTDSSNGYVAGIKEIYKWLAPNQQFACYPTKLP